MPVVPLLALFLAGVPPAASAQDLRPTPVEKQHPGYGVVESVTPLKREESASAGASRPGAAGAREPRYLIRVRLDDGSIQVRSLRKPAYRPGERVFITNAGDVVPE